MAHCITKRQKESPEYQNVMNTLNVSSEDVEVALYKYQNNPANAELMSQGKLPFPSMEYFEQELTAPAPIVSNENLKTFTEFWEKNYSKPKIYSTKEEALQGREEAQKYFAPENIDVRETKDGLWKLSIKKPVKNNKSFGDRAFSNKQNSVYDTSIISTKEIRLSNHESVLFNEQIKDGKLPQTFEVNTYNHGRVKLEKLNNRKNSYYYKVIDENGNVIAEKLKLYTEEQWLKYQEAIKDVENKFKNYNLGRSLNFKIFHTTPSKGLFKKIAKEWLREVSNLGEEKIDFKIIDEFVDKFSDSFWEHVISYITAPQEKYKTKYSLTFGEARTGNIVDAGWIFNYSIPKQGLINRLEEEFGIKIDEEKLFGKKINRALKYNELEKAVKEYLHRNLPKSTEKENVERYAKHYGLTIEEVENKVKEIRRRITEDGQIADSKELHDIIDFSPIEETIAKIKAEYDHALSSELKKRGINVPSNIVNVIFNRNILTGEKNTLNRLATIFHEPFHVFEIIAKDSPELQSIYKAYDRLMETTYGKELLQKINEFNTQYKKDEIKSEVLANLFSLIAMPKNLREQFINQSENKILGIFLGQELKSLLESDHTIKYIEAKTTKEEKQILKTVEKEQREVLPWIKQVWNDFVTLLEKWMRFSAESIKFAEKTHIIKETYVETRVTEKTTFEEVSKIDEQFQIFQETLYELNNALQDIFNTEISNNDNVSDESHFSLLESESQQQFIPFERQENVKYTSEDKINIYAGANENTQLSNFAERPFKLDSDDLFGFMSANEIFFGYNEYVWQDYENIFKRMTFPTVEHAFQALKYLFTSYGADSREYTNGRHISYLEYFVKNSPTASAARRWGKNIKNVDIARWNEISGRLMKFLLQKSFEQNPNAARLLIGTGEATLTHTQDRSAWGTEFPKILMEIREELKSQFPQEVQFVPVGTFNAVTTDKYTEVKESLPQPTVMSETTANEEQSIKQSNPQEAHQLSSRDKQFLDNSIKQNQSFDNLIGINSEFTTKEIDDLAQDVAFNLSYMLTQIEENPSLVNEMFGLDISEDKLNSLSRVGIAQLVGIQNLLNYCRESLFNTEQNVNIPEELFDKADILHQEDNFNVLVQKANAQFVAIEGWGIKVNENGKVEVEENVDISDDNFNQSENTADVAEREGNTQEHWQIDTNTLSVVQTVSQRVKQALAQCDKLDAEGNPMVSDWGVPQKVNVTEATAQILSWTKGALNKTHMLRLLEKRVNSNPWLRQIVERLQDQTGNDTEFQTQFFNSFARHHQNYSIVSLENGKYVAKPLNAASALSDAKKTISSLYAITQHPLFTSKGVNTTTYNRLFNLKEELMNTSYSEESRDVIAEKLSEVSNILGYPATKETILEILNKDTFDQMTRKSLQYIPQTIFKHKDDTTWQPFSANPNDDGIIHNIGIFIKPLTDILEERTIHSFYSKGKMYQSDVLPSYLSDMLDKFNLSNEIDPNNPAKDTPFTEFIWEEFGKYRQFRDNSKDTGNKNEDITKGWKFPWLRLLATSSKAREIFEHKVQLTFNNKSYMNSDSDAQAMVDAEYLISVLTEYGFNNDDIMTPAYFRIPMMSNKASAEYIKFYSYRGQNYQDEIADGLKMFFDYELGRIQTIKMRNKQKGDIGYIEQLDKRGKTFCFLPFLNKYVDGRENRNSRLGTLIERKTEGEELSTAEETELNNLALKAIKYEMNQMVQRQLNEYEANGIFDAVADRVNGINKENVRAQLENFIWNDTFAAKNILQLTISDIAQYKSDVDLQKRLKELQAPGIKADVQAVDFNGDRVSDGYNRTIYLTDFEGAAVKSNIIQNLKAVFNEKLSHLERGTREYEIAKQTYDNIIKQYESDINVADGQAYSSLTSMRKKMFMFGKWNRAAEQFYEKVKSGKWDYTDFQTHFNPLKPFVYTQISKSTGVDAPMTEFKLGVQNKNSEYMLMMANAILEQAGRPNILQVLSDVMEESTKLVGIDKGIDTIQFVSAVKTGITGAINIIDMLDKPNGANAAKEYIMDRIYNVTQNSDGTKTFDYKQESVHALSYEDYKIQQEIPDHFIDHFQAHGSQIRMIIPSDLSETSNFTYTDGVGKVTKDGKAFREEYERNIAENIQESLDEVTNEFNLTGTPLERRIALSRILRREILSSSRYGTDLLIACSLNEDGEFRIPLRDPVQAKRIEQLCNSIIKNRVNKQEIAGGPVVQVSNFGTSRQLQIRFNSKDGSILKSLSEYQAEGHSEEEWVKYIEENQAGISHYEVYAPATHRQFFEDFTDEKGVIDVAAIEKLNPDLLKMIGYRI